MGPGDSWTVEKVESIAELELEAVQLVHKRSGAAFTHFIADDVVNAFSVNFKTTPMDSTGISHILEHVSLCGSRKFPVRDPFFKMLNRSLSTFMNAMTGPDYTLYPFSTPNERDYYNLMSVYLDAVFRPNLNKNDFRQEGWRLDLGWVSSGSSSGTEDFLVRLCSVHQITKSSRSRRAGTSTLEIAVVAGISRSTEDCLEQVMFRTLDYEIKQQ